MCGSFNKSSIFTKVIIFCFITTIYSCAETSNNSNIQVQNTSSEKKVVQLDWMSTWTFRKSKRKLVENAARDFELLNQDIRVNLKFNEEIWPNIDPLEQPLGHTLEIMQSGKIDWDIINLNKYIYLRISETLNDPYWTQKYLINFEEFDWFRNSHKPSIINNPIFRESWGGILPGPLIEGYYHGIWYNKKVVEKIGLQIKPFGMTFDDLLSYIQKAYEYNKTAADADKVLLLSDVAPSKIKTDLLNSLIISALGDIDTSKINIKHNLGALKRALIAFEKLAQYNPLDVVTTIDPKVDPVLDGKALFGIFPSTIYNIWEAVDENKVQDVIPVELPVFEKPGIFYIGSYQSVWAVFKNAPHKEEAIRAIQFICSSDIAERWLTTTKNPTALKARIDATDFNQDIIDKFNTEISDKYEGKLAIYDISKILFGPKSKITIDGLQILRKSISAEDYYNEIVKQVKL